MGHSSAASTSLAPGFRFHPTDEELVRYYLKRKICGKSFRFDAISDIEIYKFEPWDLPGQSRLKSRDLEWYFFSPLDKKYGNGSRTNRATDKGYWKTTGKDRPVHHKSQTAGMKKTLVYHSGRAPRGERTNWVMHEYRLVDDKLDKSGVLLEAFVLCRIFQKSGSGPKNGEQYGAPFVEEEWEDDNLGLLPGGEAQEEVLVGEDAFVEANDLDQTLDVGTPPESDPAPGPLNYYYGDSSQYHVDTEKLTEGDQKPFIGTGEPQFLPELPDQQDYFELPAQYDLDTKSVEDNYVMEQGNTMAPLDIYDLLDQPFMDANENNPPFDDGLFLETNDLSEPVKADPSSFDKLEEYLTYFDADDDISKYMAFDSSEFVDNDKNVCQEACYDQKNMNGGTEQASLPNQQLSQEHSDGASSSKNSDAKKLASDFQHPCIKQASRMLESIPAPPAFASEFPSKEAALRLNSAAQSSSSIHVTAAIIQIRTTSLNGSATEWAYAKNGNANSILSFEMPHGDVNPASFELMDSMLSRKTGSVLARCWVYLMFFWVLFVSVSFKVGIYICAK